VGIYVVTLGKYLSSFQTIVFRPSSLEFRKTLGIIYTMTKRIYSRRFNLR